MTDAENLGPFSLGWGAERTAGAQKFDRAFRRSYTEKVALKHCE